MPRKKKSKEIDPQERLSAFYDDVVKDQDICMMSEKHENILIPSPIPGYNRASVCGGVATGGIYSLDGANQSGKTALAIVNSYSFISRGHPVLFIDAETTADQPWFTDLGMDISKCGYLVPESIEHCSQKVDDFIEKLKRHREDYPDMGAMIILDSLNKLRPESEMENSVIDSERGYPIHAGQITNWFYKLTPLLYKYDIAFMVVRHDRANLDRKNPYSPAYKESGPYSLRHDNSFQIRCTKQTAEKDTVDGREEIIGYWHEFEFKKNKDGIKGQKAEFFLSNGMGVIPKGHHRGMSALCEARHQHLIEKPSPRKYMIPAVSDHQFSRIELRDALIHDQELVGKLIEHLDGYWERKWGNKDEDPGVGEGNTE